jgi:enamine deaminase RidA (YjgF/YER057c/UK114 family)
MRKSVVLPTWRESPSDELAEPNSAYATITHHDDHRRVVFSGGLATEGDIEDQVRAILERRREALRDFGGCMDDIVLTQYYVLDEHLDRETQASIHEARDEFFEHPHYPASTMVGTSALLAEDAMVELEVEAEIPDDEWDTDVLTENDV